MRTDGRTDMTKLIVAFRNYANGPKNGMCNSPKVTKKPKEMFKYDVSLLIHTDSCSARRSISRNKVVPATSLFEGDTHTPHFHPWLTDNKYGCTLHEISAK